MDMDMSGGDHNSMAPNSSMGDMPMPMDMMPMYFYFGIPSSDILFKGWLPINDWQTALSCLALFFAAMFYEWLKNYRQNLHKRHFSMTRYVLKSVPPTDYRATASGVTAQQLTSSTARYESSHTSHKRERSDSYSLTKRSVSIYRSRLSWPHLLQSVLHVIQITISYLLMLVFMTYNVYLCLGVVLGAGTGYFLFGSRDGGSNLANQGDDCC